MVCKERISFKCGGQLFLIRFSKLCKTAALLFIFIISHPNISAQDVGFSESDGSGCNPLIITFTNTSDPTNTKGFDWNFGDGSPVESYDETNAGQSVIHTFTAPGNHEVRLTLHPISGTDQIEIHIISIYSIDIPAAQASALVLCNGTVTFTNTSNPDITPGARTTLWDFGDGSTDNNATTTHTFPMTVDSLYRVKMINSNICGFDSTFLDIQVYPINNQIVTDVDPVYCVNNNVAFSNLGHKNNMTYLWDFSDGTTSTLSTPIHEFTLPNTYKITMVTDIGGGQGCHDSITTDLTFLPGPKAGFIATYDTTCNSTNSSFSNTTTGPNDSWDWDFGNGQNFLGENPSGSYHYGVPGNYPVMLIATNTANGCSDTSTQFIFVPSYPVASFTCTNVCLGKDALFFDASVTGAITPILIWSWDFNGEQTSIIANPSIVFNTPGQKQVILDVATHYCSDDTLITVVVEDIPHISFTPSDTIGCAPLPVAFNNSTTLAMSYHWIFGDSYTDTATSPIHQFNTLPLTDTTYTTKLYASTAFGCIDSAIQNITVLFTPDAQFISDASITPVCTIDTVLFTSTTMGASQLEWDFGDGTHGSDSVEVHEYQNSNPFFKHFEINLIAIAANGCPDTSLTGYVTMYPKPRSEFLFDSLNNCHPAQVGFYAPIEQDATYVWDFGDGSPIEQTIQDVTSHFFTNPSLNDSTFFVKLVTISQFGCVDSTQKPVVVHYKPLADFAMNPNPAKTNEMVSFTNLSENKTGWEHSWFFDASDTSSYIGFEPPDQGFNTYFDVEITLFIKSEFGCKDTVIKVLQIIPPPPRLDFVTDTLNGCPPVTIIFTDASEFVDTTTYLWNFGDGSYSTQVNPIHSFYSSGLTTVILTANSLNGLSLAKDTLVDIYFKPSAGFSFNPEKPYIPDQPVKCSPEFPADSLTYFWDFSDGTIDTAESPVHFYQDTGSFSITFIVTSQRGCIDSLTKELVAIGGGSFVAPNVFFPGNNGNGGGSGGNGNGAYIEPGSLDNSVFAPLCEGVLEYHLEIYNRWGERLFISDQKDYGWTGYYRQKLCKEDVYVWKATGIFSSGEAFVKAGTITLLHNEQ